MSDGRTPSRWRTGSGAGVPARADEIPARQPVLPTAGAKPLSALGLAGTGFGAKSVLLVDADSQTRKSRAEVMRNYGVLVDAVASAETARTKLDSGTYNLILVDPGRDLESARSLQAEIKARNPRQLVGFLVGGPRFITTSVGGNSGPARRVSQPAARSANAPPAAAPPLKTPPTANSRDFGQRIRAAAGEKTAWERHSEI